MHKHLVFFTPLCFLVASLWTVFALAADTKPAASNNVASPATSQVPDSKKLEKELQHLPWGDFRSVIESVPKLKSDVEHYGSRGWTYVQANYQSYGWKKNIDKLDLEQKKRLADLIEKAKQAKQSEIPLAR